LVVVAEDDPLAPGRAVVVADPGDHLLPCTVAVGAAKALVGQPHERGRIAVAAARLAHDAHLLPGRAVVAAGMAVDPALARAGAAAHDRDELALAYADRGRHHRPVGR